jgi:predicted ABC-type ATPase
MPTLILIAGPNGAGKTTFIKRFAPRHLTLLDFRNADDAVLIAHGTSAALEIDHRELFETLVREFNLKS